MRKPVVQLCRGRDAAAIGRHEAQLRLEREVRTGVLGRLGERAQLGPVEEKWIGSPVEGSHVDEVHAAVEVDVRVPHEAPRQRERGPSLRRADGLAQVALRKSSEQRQQPRALCLQERVV